jgi:hypothetical protein
MAVTIIVITTIILITRFWLIEKEDPALCRVFLFGCGRICLRSAFFIVNADRIY